MSGHLSGPQLGAQAINKYQGNNLGCFYTQMVNVIFVHTMVEVLVSQDICFEVKVFPFEINPRKSAQ